MKQLNDSSHIYFVVNLHTHVRRESRSGGGGGEVVSQAHLLEVKMVITFLDALYRSKFSDNQKEEKEEEQKGSSHFRLCRYMLGLKLVVGGGGSGEGTFSSCS